MERNGKSETHTPTLLTSDSPNSSSALPSENGTTTPATYFMSCLPNDCASQVGNADSPSSAMATNKT